MKTLSYKLLCSSLLALALPSLCGAKGDSSEPKVQLAVDLAHPLIPSGKKMTTYLKIGLTGFALEASAKRAPVNVTIVIDKSGSMGGEKIIHAREAAKQALDRLGEQDRVSVIAYDDQVHVIAAASGLSERESVKAAIDKIEAGGSTALFAGVSKGAEELRKNKKPNQVNRIVLLSDGMANVGPAAPRELGRLGASLSKEGITVTTLGLGLGYNEDLMTELALRSDGNHAFIQDSEKLAAVFQSEFGDILSVVAQRLAVKVRTAAGVRPVRVLGREADIHGQEVTVVMNQLYAKQEKYALLEVEIAEGAPATDAQVAEVQLTYLNTVTGKEDMLNSRSVARRVSEVASVTESVNKNVMLEVAKYIATEKEALAVKLNDEGDKEGAMKAYSAAAAWSFDNGLNDLGQNQLLRQEMFKEGGDRANAARKMSKREDFEQKSQNNSFKR